MVFHEITREAIQRAVNDTREIDTAMVDAQETRRILDRLYGYEVSPVLWRKVRQGLSAGRVQSVATRMVVERERERMAFVRSSYWDVEGDFTPDGASQQFTARLSSVDGVRVATGRDFADDGRLTGKGVVHLDEALATRIAEARACRSARASPTSRRSPTPAARRRRSRPRPSSRRRRASCGCRPRTRCAWRSGSTRTATSPTCVPTARRCRTPP